MKEEISLKFIFDIIKSRIILILSATIIVAVAVALITEFYITPKYTSSIKLCVVSDVAVTDTSISGKRNEYLYAQDIIETCIEAINTGDAYAEMNAKLRELDSSYENTKITSSDLNISQVNSTSVLLITATTPDPALSYNVCKAFEKMASERIPKVGDVKTELLDSPVEAISPSSPNLLKNSVIGALGGFFICTAIVILIEMLDNTVKDGEELAKQMGILLLAEIPDIYSLKEHEKYYEYKAHSGKSSAGGTKHGR